MLAVSYQFRMRQFNLGYGKLIFYSFSGQDNFPDTVTDRLYYIPGDQGYEKKLKEKLTYFKDIKERRRS